ncbi:hypothetical protein PHSC3_001885 [Chlamydiales bacterium STE3]|nr:hypothetical protein PHSC3_001885 [Chlamydiales bacterium STE3]
MLLKKLAQIVLVRFHQVLEGGLMILIIPSYNRRMTRLKENLAELTKELEDHKQTLTDVKVHRLALDKLNRNLTESITDLEAFYGRHRIIKFFTHTLPNFFGTSTLTKARNLRDLLAKKPSAQEKDEPFIKGPENKVMPVEREELGDVAPLLPESQQPGPLASKDGSSSLGAPPPAKVEEGEPVSDDIEDEMSKDKEKEEAVKVASSVEQNDLKTGTTPPESDTLSSKKGKEKLDSSEEETSKSPSKSASSSAYSRAVNSSQELKSSYRDIKEQVIGFFGESEKGRTDTLINAFFAQEATDLALRTVRENIEELKKMASGNLPLLISLNIDDSTNREFFRDLFTGNKDKVRLLLSSQEDGSYTIAPLGSTEEQDKELILKTLTFIEDPKDKEEIANRLLASNKEEEDNFYRNQALLKDYLKQRRSKQENREQPSRFLAFTRFNRNASQEDFINKDSTMDIQKVKKFSEHMLKPEVEFRKEMGLD